MMFRSWQYKPWEPWSHSNQKKTENSARWKNESSWKKNRPLCGAQCRDGHFCKAKVVVDSKTREPINGRCRMHGGLSTGAKTQEGKDKSREAARRGMLAYWAKKR
jgi:hypothetical protein